MKFLLDENFPVAAWTTLNNTFRSHTFGRVGAQIEKGLTDLELFKRAAAEGYNAIITSDVKQIDIPEERQACKNANLHWIGIPRPNRARGKNIPLTQIGQTLLTLNYIIEHLNQTTQPTAILLTQYPAHMQTQKGFPQNL